MLLVLLLSRQSLQEESCNISSLHVCGQSCKQMYICHICNILQLCDQSLTCQSQDATPCPFIREATTLSPTVTIKSRFFLSINAIWLNWCRCQYQFNGGFYTQQQAIVHLFEWHWDWIADECEKVKEIPKRVVASREALYVIMRQNNCFLTLWRQKTN